MAAQMNPGTPGPAGAFCRAARSPSLEPSSSWAACLTFSESPEGSSAPAAWRCSREQTARTRAGPSTGRTAPGGVHLGPLLGPGLAAIDDQTLNILTSHWFLRFGMAIDERSLQPEDSPVHQRFHRADRDADDAGDLRLPEPLDLLKHEHPALLFRESRNRQFDPSLKRRLFRPDGGIVPFRGHSRRGGPARVHSRLGQEERRRTRFLRRASR